ncbi:MAG: hypothetical protein A2600_04620 [Candidatus Lambdaproteobacteria bacterium RIFOXYD1_FULL_56_27]|uniref:POTRA domain-containing protein n=1 Tax=Candidatus Lambdaproteobacteria bacterium RIFOXYD2_FULL_56_26 TaxID=1817773 RepID=A0A1F6H3T4_9PROT|nr:MAG: hypothetical protein A2426_13685 [Candidatus Lambdaproteobacteria bacterium RIFOXYC1_FULL_56_13]OGH05038.1 MAG: hypothetical protein A2557_08685 [Candidatus Lambdaproteobacteria bacterium RIFOXYD2_FULL_56_26]OGH09503.1 MAG: hypothetical protein A2600_04620 [Candidatus Lambdaproteobacteria bacterium RIFOXYD1_FULL_56_27]
MKKKTILFLSVCLWPGLALAWTGEVRILGNGHSQTSYLEDLTRSCLGGHEALEPQDLKEVQDCIGNTELFFEVKLRAEPSLLVVEVKERWSLLPIPLVVGEKNQDTKYGAILVERNLMGLGKLLAVGGDSSKKSSTVFLRYEDKSLGFTPLYLRLTWAKIRRQALLYRGHEVIDGNDEDRLYQALDLGYHVTQAFTPTLLYEKLDKRYYESSGRAAWTDLSYQSLGVRLSLDLGNFRFYFKEGWQLSLEQLAQQWRSDGLSLDQKTLAKVQWQGATVEDQALQVKAEVFFSRKDDPRTASQLGSREGVRGVPAYGAWAKDYRFLSLDYQIPLGYSAQGVWTAAPFWDGGRIVLAQRNLETVDYRSYGLGTYFFLKEIALPGLGFLVGRNDPYESFFYKITLGFEF